MLKKKGKNAVRNKLFIKDIENITGIKAHTIRIWEQRYNLLKPKRTDTGIRYYDEDDLKIIMNVSILNLNGFKISKIVQMTQEEITSVCSEFSENQSQFDTHVQQLVATIVTFDEREFNKLLTLDIIKQGIEQTMIQVVFPFLNHVSQLWLSGTVHTAHVHYITTIIRQKLFVSIDGLNVSPNSESKKFLLFNPPGEPNDIGLLFANYALRRMGHNVIYLGLPTPFEDLHQVFQDQEPDYVYCNINSQNSNVNVQPFVNFIGKHWKETPFLLSGLQITGKKDLKITPNIQILENAQELLDFLEDLRQTLRYNKNLKNFSQALDPIINTIVE
ncbi:MAG: MerR family transcriptional regulator [Bacteroidia bacterium]|nr:MerR family transcriptional regulator [Bacteroidia bacterium]